MRAFLLRSGTATVSLIAERHAVRPRGAAGGGDGAPGSHTLMRNGADATALPAKTTVALEANDTIVIRTAGGGGYGDPAQRSADARERDRRSGLVSP